MIQIKPNSKVIVMPHKDNTNIFATNKTGTVKLIQNKDGIDLYYIHIDRDISGFSFPIVNIPYGHGYIAIYEELALIE